ncbi:hypothetical protein RIEGSTA812A_PEG_939 [invertebrate metagenome]|uniref:Uncharacterized protein n=1 Tax=invertebrate metagenome TaxID=1711999 RepID=A0A484H5X6_9ZZZZ
MIEETFAPFVEHVESHRELIRFFVPHDCRCVSNDASIINVESGRTDLLPC